MPTLTDSTDSHVDFERSKVDAELLAFDKRWAVLPGMPLDCVSLFVLKKPGDFCVTETPQGGYYLSILVDGNEKKKEDHVVHLQIEYTNGEFGLLGILFGHGDSIGKLLYNLHNSAINALSGVLDEEVVFRRLVTKTALESEHIYHKSAIVKSTVVHTDLDFTHYNAKLLMRGKRRKVLLLSPTQMPESDFKRLMFEELRMSFLVRHHNLPVRSPIGIVLDGPMIVHENRSGYTLEYFLEMYRIDLDIAIRVQLCAATSRVMSELHNFGMFHGGVQAKNFYIFESKKGPKVQLSLVFNGSEGLVPQGKAKLVSFVDYDIYAPEIAWTRAMTPESGVFSLGRLFSQIVEPHAGDVAPALLQLKSLIASATRADPFKRPSMDGILLSVNKILPLVSATKSNYVLTVDSNERSK